MGLEIRDGCVYKNGVEVFELTIHEQDALIKQLYPNDPTLLSVSETRKKQTSWSGTSAFNLDNFESAAKEDIDITTCAMAEYVYKWGGTRLLTLYCHRFNFQGAAMDLGMKYGALMKWWQRFRDRAKTSGLTKDTLFSELSTMYSDSMYNNDSK